jgi:uncharacterized protein (DUF3084 family)
MTLISFIYFNYVELADVCAERDRIRLKLQDMGTTLQTVSHDKRSVEVERDDLIEAYKKVLQERRTLESNLHDMR